MTYVHKLLPCKPTKGFPYSESTHLVADTVKELYEFAEKLGLRREWIQGLDKELDMPHFDLTPALHAQAVRKGAAELSLAAFAAKTIAYKKDRMKLKEVMKGGGK